MNDLALFGVWCIERLDKWQTLLTGVAAVGAAALTIRQTGAQHRSELWRKGNAARATLAIVLSDICDWATRSATDLVALRATADAANRITHHARVGVALARAAQENIASLQRMIEATDEASVVDRIWKMLGRIQVLSGRVRGLDDPILLVNVDDVNGYIIEAGTIYAQASTLFRYARREIEQAEMLTWDEVTTALHIFGLRTQADEALYEQIERSKARGVNPER